MASQRSHYDILGVAPEASVDEIRSAFREAANRNHPDRFSTYVQKVRATALMQEITASYSVLRDPALRARYDSTLRSRMQSQSHHGTSVAAHDVLSTRRPVPPESLLSLLRDPGILGFVIVWLLIVGASIFIQLRDETVTAGSFLKAAAFAIVSSPMVFIFGMAIVVFPLAVVASVTADAFSSRRANPNGSKKRLLVDFVVRLVLLGGLVTLGIGVWSPEMLLNYLFYALLAGIGAVAGDLAAMLLFLLRRRSLQTALARIPGESTSLAGA